MTRLHKAMIVLLVIAGLVYASAFVVDERDLAIKFKLGEIVKSDFEPGLYWMIPFLNNVQVFDKRIQTQDSRPEKYMTNEKKNVIVDAFVKWRIVDPAQFYVSTEQGSFRKANELISEIVNNALKNKISQRTIKEAISGERAIIMKEVKEKTDIEARGLGITIVDVRIKKLDYSEDISDSVHQRMVKERATVAKKLRSEGQEAYKVIRAEADREREEILAEAYREAETIRGEGDAKSAAIYARAFRKNREFYSFYRSLKAYRETFNSGQDILVLDPDSEFFRYFKKSSGIK